MFGKKKKETEYSLPTVPTTYPSGTVVRTPSGTWLLKDKRKFQILSERVLKSWSFPIIVDSTDEAISKYLRVGKLGLREGTYFIDTRTGERFVVSDGKKRQIVDPKWFKLLGLDPATPLWVSSDESDMHDAGEVLK